MHNSISIVVGLITRLKVYLKSTLGRWWNPLATNLALNLSMVPTTFLFTLKTHLLPITFYFDGGTNAQVLFLIKALNSLSIASLHFLCFMACDTQVGSIGLGKTCFSSEVIMFWVWLKNIILWPSHHGMCSCRYNSLFMGQINTRSYRLNGGVVDLFNGINNLLGRLVVALMWGWMSDWCESVTIGLVEKIRVEILPCDGPVGESLWSCPSTMIFELGKKYVVTTPVPSKTLEDKLLEFIIERGIFKDERVWKGKTCSINLTCLDTKIWFVSMSKHL